MRFAVALLLLILLIGFIPTWPYAAGWGLGWFPSGILGLVLLVVVLMALFSTDTRGRPL